MELKKLKYGNIRGWDGVKVTREEMIIGISQTYCHLFNYQQQQWRLVYTLFDTLKGKRERCNKHKVFEMIQYSYIIHN